MLNSLREYLGLNERTSLLLLGINGSGKTSILFRLSRGEFVQTIPTIGKILFQNLSLARLEMYISYKYSSVTLLAT